MSEVGTVRNFGGRQTSHQNSAGIIQQLRHLVASIPEDLDPADARKAYRIEEMLRARAARGDFFNPRLFADPAWDMLLALYAAHCEQRRVAVRSLADAVGIPLTTGLRWMDALLKEGLICRRQDPLDRRRIFIELSDKGRNTLAAYFESLPSGLRPL